MYGFLHRLGHKRTLERIKAMSALPRKQTFGGAKSMSAKCHKQTSDGVSAPRLATGFKFPDRIHLNHARVMLVIGSARRSRRDAPASRRAPANAKVGSSCRTSIPYPYPVALTYALDK